MSEVVRYEADYHSLLRACFINRIGLKLGTYAGGG
jgi:hypothetical protein